MRKMISTAVFLLCLLCTTWVLAQQEVNYNMYRYHLNLINPAVTGTQGAAYANFSLRTQWVGIADAPETQAFSAGTPNKRQRLGTGFSVINDKTFVENQTQLFADFSYRLPLDNERDLYLGLKAGGTSIRLHADRLKTYGSVLPDQFLTSQSSFVPNIGVGLYYKSPTYFVSLSIPRLLSTERFRFDDGQVSRATDRPHFFGSVGGRWALTSNWEFIPSALFSYVSAAPFDYFLNASVAYKATWDIGLQYTRGGGLGGATFFRLSSGTKVGYAYVTSAIDQVSRFSKGTHELVVKFKLGNFPTSEKEPSTEEATDTAYRPTLLHRIHFGEEGTHTFGTNSISE